MDLYRCSGPSCGVGVGEESGVVAFGKKFRCDCEICNNETGEELMEADAEEEVEARQTLLDPILLSQSDIDDHCIDHAPYRFWCRWCVEGRGREMAHRPFDQEG